ncbi:MAG: hypothetical protein DMF70_15290 [Acidobacteria bacterium]|nr:MAG: hypothetical protein DMF70_15290 [Acidobacteriota bacterium]
MKGVPTLRAHIPPVDLSAGGVISTHPDPAGFAAPVTAIMSTSPRAKGKGLRAKSTSKESKTMSDPNRFTIICPCCESTLNVDAQTGAILSHEEKQKPLASFEDMARNLDKAKQTREQIFAQEMSSMKDRERLLDEKFKEAMKRAEKDKDKIYHNPMDLD